MEVRDAADVFEYARNPAVLHYTTGSPPQGIGETREFLEAALSDPSTYVWAVRDKPAGPVVGAIELGIRAPDTGQLDYALAASHWGRGLMTEAVGAIASWAFAEIATLTHIMSAVRPENAGSWRVLEKCGFTRIGETTERWSKRE